MAEGMGEKGAVPRVPPTEGELAELLTDLDFFLEMDEAADLPLEEEDAGLGESDEKPR